MIFFCLYRWGRKRALLSSVVLFIIGWILVATANHVVQFYVVRFIFGIATTFPYTILPMYYGEIAEVNLFCMCVQARERHNYLYAEYPKIIVFSSVSCLKCD